MSNVLQPATALPDPALGLTPALRAVLLHAVCVPLAWLLAGSTPWWLAAESLFAAAGSLLLGFAPWWLPINALFVPALAAALAIDFHPAWALGAFLLMALSYWGVARTQVPLFLSGDAAVRALLHLLPQSPRPRLIDLGCGDARVLARVAAARGDAVCHGIEYAPLPWLAGWLRCLGRGARCSVRWGDFWTADLGGYDLVYAYLSPVPMARLWRKAGAEMRPGTLLISNGFAVPGVEPEAVVALGDAWAGRLYVYRMPGPAAAEGA